MRARIVLAAFKIDYILREVDLKNKPIELVNVSAKATVPVLLLNDLVIDESLDILTAIAKTDFTGPLVDFVGNLAADFIKNLNYYKYPARYDDFKNIEFYQHSLISSLNNLDEILTQVVLAKHDIAQIAIYPFVRQLRQFDRGWFASVAKDNVLNWLDFWDDFLVKADVMAKYPAWSGLSDGVLIDSAKTIV